MLYDEKSPTAEDSLETAGRLPLASQNGNFTMRGAASAEPFSPGYSNEAPSHDLSVKGLDGTHLSQHDHRDLKPRSLQEHTNSENSLDPQTVTNGERSEGAHRKGPNGLFPDSD